jgi:MFS family permease
LTTIRIRFEGKLWRHKDFLRFWFGDTVSQFTSQVTVLALPTVAILTLGANAFEVGLLGTLQFLAFPILGMFVGVWADRYRRRPIMIVANLGRMISLGLIPVAAILHSFSLNLLYLVATVTGICTVFFDVCYQSYLPVLIDKDDLVEGNSKLQLSASSGQVGGPALAGFLIYLLGAAEAVTVDAAGFLTSAIALLSIRKQEPKPVPKIEPDFFGEMREGTKVVLGNNVLNRIAGCTATANLGSQIANVLLLIFAYQTLHLSTQVMGVVFSIGSTGVLFGAWVAGSASKKFGLGRTIALSSTASIGLLIIPLALVLSPIAVLAVAEFIVGVLVAVYNINQVSLRQAITSDELQGRMNATMRTIVWGTIPIGSFLGGVLGDRIGVVNAIIIGAIVSTFAFLWVLSPAVLALKTIPERTEGSDLG